MNPSIKKLAEIAQKEERIIIGLMSGTSLDGLDIALCRISGSGEHTRVFPDKFITKPYKPETRSQLKNISSVGSVEMAELCRQHTWLAGLHAELILEALSEWGVRPQEVDCIASHGQTVYHLPSRDQHHPYEKPNSTLQIADGDHIAVKTGILTISDFRQKHTAAGSEGAPMAGLVDHLLFTDESETRILLNIGGIGNFTLVPSKNNPDQNYCTTDTGPGNTLIDKLCQELLNIPYDENARIAATGNINEKLLQVMHSDSWFDSRESKTTGPEYFSMEWLSEKCNDASIDMNSIKPEDIIRTATELSSQTIAASISSCLKGQKAAIYVSGGGAHNLLMMERITSLLGDCTVQNFSELGMDPDAKEAVIFAVLANEMLAGKGFIMSGLDASEKKMNFGKISFPE